jgi:cysteine-rich repeat protein
MIRIIRGIVSMVTGVKEFRSGDGCDDVCRRENGWTCSGAPSLCLAFCGKVSYEFGVTPWVGDGIITGLETCDDNNTFNGDGCTSTCSIEYGWICTGS